MINKKSFSCLRLIRVRLKNKNSNEKSNESRIVYNNGNFSDNRVNLKKKIKLNLTVPKDDETKSQ